MDCFPFEYSVQGQWSVPWFSHFISGWIVPVPMVWETEWVPRPFERSEDSTSASRMEEEKLLLITIPIERSRLSQKEE